MTTQQLLENAKAAKLEAMLLDTDTKNAALLAMADKLTEYTDRILSANKVDVENARGIISDVMIDRLSLQKRGFLRWHREYATWQHFPTL